MTIIDIYDLIIRGGVPAGLMVLVHLMMTGRLVTGRELKRCDDVAAERLREIAAERDKWRDLALENTALAGRLVNRVPPASP